MAKPPSRKIRDYIGRFFHARPDEQHHTPECQFSPASDRQMLEAWHVRKGCRLAGAQPPIILHTIWINDLCGRDPASEVLLHYADDHATQPLFAKERAEVPEDHLGVWPYTQAQISYEVLQGSQVIGQDRLRFRINELKDPFPADFLRAAAELNLPPEALFEIARFHANPVVEFALRASVPHP